MNKLYHILFSLILLCLFSVLRAQTPQHVPPTPLPREMMDRMNPTQTNPAQTTTKPNKSYTDSAEFAKTFKEFYPLVKPKQSVKEAAEQSFARLSRSFKEQGIDSAQAYKAAMHGLDTNANERIFFNIYRENFSAKELKAYLTFLKTTEGKHIIEVLPNLQRAAGESGTYVQRTIMSNFRPIQQAAREKMMKENPPKEGDRNPAMGDPNGRRMPPGMRMPQRDSLGRPIPPQK